MLLQMVMTGTTAVSGIRFEHWNECGLKSAHEKSNHLCLRVPKLRQMVNDSNDALVEYNEISRCGLDTADTGAIYYGRDPSVLGIQIRHNYFHDIGNRYGGYGQQAIFCDDAGAMPFIYGNVFANASDKSPVHGAAVKANGAQFGVVKNNIFIQSPTAASFSPWTFGQRGGSVREDSWLMNVYGIDDPTEHYIWKKLTEDVDFFSEAWKDYYKGTQWEPIWDYIMPEGYAEAWRIYQAEDSGLHEGEVPEPDDEFPEGYFSLDYESHPGYYRYAYRNAP